MSKKNIIIIAVIALVIIGGAGGFYLYTQAQNKNNSNNSTSTTAQAGARGGRFGGGAGGAGGTAAANFKTVTGSVVAIADKQLTVEDSTGNQDLIVLSDTTRVTKTSTDTSDDVLKVNNNIMVVPQSGTSNPAVATSITLQPAPTANTNGTNGNMNNTGGNGTGRGNRTGGTGTPPAGAQNSAFANMIRGQITAIDGQTVTVKNFNGDSVTVTYNDQTKFGKVDTGAITDIAANQNVTVTTTTSNGIDTARTVSIDS
jgi:hypothetical protein